MKEEQIYSPYDIKLARTMIPFVDHTSLTGEESEGDITRLCREAIGNGHQPSAASVCIYPRFISTAADALEGTDVKIATVVNFPHGNWKSSFIYDEAEKAIEDGAHEIDFVTRPVWKKDSGYDEFDVRELWAMVSDLCWENAVCSKVILESAAWADKDALRQHARGAIAAQVDFLKTSTGFYKTLDPKQPTGATPEDVQILLGEVLRAEGNYDCGVKVSGGISSFDDAKKFFEQAENVGLAMRPGKFRFGTSKLLPVLRQMLSSVAPK